MDTNPDNVAYKIFWARGVHHQYALLNRKSPNIPTGPRSVIFWACRSLKQEKAGNTTARPNTYPIRPVCSPKKNKARLWNWRKYPRSNADPPPRRVPSPAGQAGTWRRSLEPWTSSAGDPALRLPALPHRTHPGIHAVASCLMPRRLGVTRGEP